jgi:hypothetical protein
MLAAMRAEAAAEGRRLHEAAEADVQAYVERRRREADRVVEAARRERRRPGSDE